MLEIVKAHQLALGAGLWLILCCFCTLSDEWRLRSSTPGQKPKYRRETIKFIWNKIGITPAIIFALLAFFSLPLGLFHNWFKKRTLFAGLDAKKIVELYVLLWTLANLGFVFVVIERHAVCALFPILRLFDMLYIFLFAFTTDLVPKPPVRALILLIVHYLEIILAFASIYLILQSRAGEIFTMHLSGLEAFYFSFVTGTTIGFGDIVIKLCSVPTHISIWTKAALASIVLEVFCLLAITVLEIPRVLGHMFTQPTPPEPPLPIGV